MTDRPGPSRAALFASRVRRALPVVVCVVVGLVVTAGLTGAGAWNLRTADLSTKSSVRVSTGSVSNPAAQRALIDIARFDGLGASFSYSRLLLGMPVKPGDTSVLPVPPRDWTGRIMVPWLTGERPWPERPRQEWREVKVAGFPFRSFWCDLVRVSTPAKGGHELRIEGGWLFGESFQLATATSWQNDYPIIVPYRPIWPELVGNVACWGGLFGLLVWGPGLARRVLRGARGRCVACGYDLKGLHSASRCPECGFAVSGDL